MSTINLRDARAWFSGLLEAAVEGEFIAITRHGKPVDAPGSREAAESARKAIARRRAGLSSAISRPSPAANSSATAPRPGISSFERLPARPHCHFDDGPGTLPDGGLTHPCRWLSTILTDHDCFRKTSSLSRTRPQTTVGQLFQERRAKLWQSKGISYQTNRVSWPIIYQFFVHQDRLLQKATAAHLFDRPQREGDQTHQ